MQGVDCKKGINPVVHKKLPATKTAAGSMKTTVICCVGLLEDGDGLSVPVFSQEHRSDLRLDFANLHTGQERPHIHLEGIDTAGLGHLLPQEEPRNLLQHRCFVKPVQKLILAQHNQQLVV